MTWVKWNIASFHLETVLVSVQDRCMVLRKTFHCVRNHFGCTQWYHLVMWLKWKLVSVHLEIVLMLSQDRCTVCIEHIIGSKIVLDAPDGTPR